jgi:hypothetical protein
LGRWAGGEKEKRPGWWAERRGVRSGLSFFKTFSNLSISNSFQISPKAFKTFKTSNQHTKHYATKI